MIALTPGNRPLMVGGNVLTFGAGSAPPVAPPAGGSMPTTSIAGWWDATTLTAGVAVSTITDRSTAGNNATTTAKAVPRVAGMLGGLYAEGGVSNYTVQHPVINDYSVNATAVAVGSNQAFTILLVWSRPNQRQPGGGSFSSTPVALLDIGGVTVLSMTANGNGADVLTLFPNGSPITAGTLELRHTHSARLVFSGSTVDLWLDGAKVVSVSPNQITLGATANLAFLNAAQCIFHEAAAWAKTLSASEHTDLTSYLARWPLGPRRAANGIVIGQSNAGNFLGSYALWPTLNNAIAYWTGCISSNLLWSTAGVLGGGTIFSGRGLYDGTANLLLNSSGGGDPSTWPLGTDGNTLMAALDSMTPDRAANFRYIAWFWSESDSAALTYANKATYLAAMKRAFSLIRAHVSKTATQLPVLVINALPFDPGAVGAQTHREVMADLVADSAQNCRFMLAQSNDAIGQGDSWDAGTGLESGAGNSAHRDSTGVLMYARRWASPIARAVVAANAANSTPDVITAIDASVPVTGGPKITAAHYEGGTSLLVTLAHDGGNDLIVPLRAALGVGWTLMDGVNGTTYGTPGAPGALITATACVRVNATQVRLTLANAPANPGKAQLYYVYGTGLDVNNYAVIGQGNAVTDNYAAVTPAAGWRIKDYLGAAAQPNNPVQTTAYGVALT